MYYLTYRGAANEGGWMRKGAKSLFSFVPQSEKRSLAPFLTAVPLTICARMGRYGTHATREGGVMRGIRALVCLVTCLVVATPAQALTPVATMRLTEL